jgi:hypothetical protein
VRYATPVHGRSVVTIRLLAYGKDCLGGAEYKHVNGAGKMEN